MEQGQEFPTDVVLGAVADGLKHSHPHLHVTLSSNHATFEESLSAAQQSVSGLLDRILLPNKDPVYRQRLREMAVQNQNTDSEGPQLEMGRPIRTAGMLSDESMPTPLSPHRQALLKKRFVDDDNYEPRSPYALNLRPLLSEKTLAAVVGNVVLSAIDYDNNMPRCEMRHVQILWDTGAPITVITSDVLTDEFRKHLSDPVHQPYRNHDMTRVQAGFFFEFSNVMFQQDSIALIVDKEAVPNGRSGIILGQKACIEVLQYRSIPRAILEARGETVEEQFWGDLVVESYVHYDGTLQQV
ncbi:uncharacterized protein N7515_010277 [Penicillium bovifimosum]|uniref:Peptidase A2 domain-containing protein n=1 Tax=Penicillium bovifimosum TaxID=126998 RepID=A0A9W9GIG1_9EURO|nr:uncharacterized protein N7515_010277 [Penicillium bovifimosum]KAJ5120889.1 hypothetical protein N7515_010277 [Penicillium bovifimosum]